MVGAPSHEGPPVCLHFEKTPQRGNTGGSIGQEKVPQANFLYQPPSATCWVGNHFAVFLVD
jgi:hypothetical protein